MKRFVLVLSFMLSIPLASRADDASRHAKAKQMIAMMHMDRLIRQVMDSTMKQVQELSKQMAGGNIAPADQAKVDQFQRKVLALVESQMSWTELEPIYVDLYAKTYSDDELDGILAFYKSPAGTAMLEKNSALTAQAQQIGEDRMKALQPQLMEMLQDFTKQMAKP